MNDSSKPKNPVEIYLTKEQIYRLAGLANDCLVGIQIGSDCADNTRAFTVMVDVDNSTDLRYFEIEPDGKLTETT